MSDRPTNTERPSHMAANNKPGGRTFILSHKGTRVIVKEGYDSNVVIQTGRYQEQTPKKFPAAVRQAVTWLLENAGEMNPADYERTPE